MSRMRFQKYPDAMRIFLEFLNVLNYLIVKPMYMTDNMNELLNEKLRRSPRSPCTASSMKRRPPA